MMAKYFIFSFMFLVLYGCGGGSGSSSSSNPPPDIPNDPETIVRNAGFNGVITFKQDDSDMLTKAFGSADSANNISNTIATKFRIGSLTKAFTGLAIVKLKQANLIQSYDDTLDSYISDYPRGNEITIRHLLNHLSGIPEYTPLVSPDRPYTPLEMVNLIKNRPLEFSPGEQFSYSNSNYILLGYLIELLSGTSYYDYLNTQVLSVLGMVNTEVSQSLITADNYAKGYRVLGEPAQYIDMSIPYAAGALSSNIGDMENWAKVFVDAADNSVLTAMDKDHIFSATDYSFGWGITDIEGHHAYIHTGGVPGFTSIIAIFPDNNSYMIALSNIEGKSQQLNNIVTSLVKAQFNSQ